MEADNHYLALEVDSSLGVLLRFSRFWGYFVYFVLYHYKVTFEALLWSRDNLYTPYLLH